MPQIRANCYLCHRDKEEPQVSPLSELSSGSTQKQLLRSGPGGEWAKQSFYLEMCLNSSSDVLVWAAQNLTAPLHWSSEEI